MGSSGNGDFFVVVDTDPSVTTSCLVHLETVEEWQWGNCINHSSGLLLLTVVSNSKLGNSVSRETIQLSCVLNSVLNYHAHLRTED